MATILSWEERHRRRRRRERLQNLAVGIGALAIIAIAFLIVLSRMTAAHADWKPQYASEPQYIQDWYQSATLTEAAQKRFNFVMCCSAAEVVKTQFRVDRKNGADAWFYWKNDHWEEIPSDIIHWNESAPDNKPTLFALDHDVLGAKKGDLTCFYPGSGGF